MTTYERFNLAVQRSQYVFPTMIAYLHLSKLIENVDVTVLFLDEMQCQLPESYNKVVLSNDENGPLFLISR